MADELAIDPVACEAYGYCAELLPELIGLDEWGYPVVASGDVPPELAELARWALRQCPKRAIHLRPTSQRNRSDSIPLKS